MVFKIRTAEIKDIPSLMDIYFAAFKNDLDRLYFPDTAVNRKCWTRELRNEIVDPGIKIFLVVDELHGEETIVAWSQWVLYDVQDIAIRPDYLDDKYWQDGSVEKGPEMEYELSPDVEPQVVLDYLREQWATHARIAPRSHWYLEIIATSPKYQRRGAGSLLLEYGLAVTDVSGLEVYLEGSPMAVPLYRRFGFEKKATITLVSPVQTRQQIIMLRQPKWTKN